MTCVTGARERERSYASCRHAQTGRAWLTQGHPHQAVLVVQYLLATPAQGLGV
jgi:hypothetical protein